MLRLANSLRWLANYSAIQTIASLVIAMVAAAIFWPQQDSANAVLVVFIVWLFVTTLISVAARLNRDRVDGFLFSATYRLLPLTWPYLREDFQEGPNRHSSWNDRPAIVRLVMSVARKDGLQNCNLTLKNAGRTHRNLLFKGQLGVNTQTHEPSRTSDWFEPRLFAGDIPRRISRTYFLLVDIALPIKGQRIGWVIDSDGESPISGDCAVRREPWLSRLQAALSP
jgi:hypothetical protein